MREQVLELLQRNMPTRRFRPSGQSNYLTTCPFHKGGEERTPSFSVNVDKGIWHCFTCHEAGNLKRLLRMLGLPRATIDAETRIIAPYLERNADLHRLRQQNAFVSRDPFKTPHELPEELLGVYDFDPTTLIADGFDRALLRDLDIGLDRRLNRITYPLRDLYGNLAGISGGAVEKGVQPKYKVYQGGRSVEGRRQVGDFGDAFDEMFPGFTCENHNFLWNFDRVYPRVTASQKSEFVLVVEGFKACIWAIQNGFQNTTALMGSYISDVQQRLLHRLGCDVVLLLDNDRAGMSGALSVGDLLWKPLHGRVFVAPYPWHDVMGALQNGDNTQPDDYEPDVVRWMVQSRIPFTQYLNVMRRYIAW